MPHAFRRAESQCCVGEHPANSAKVLQERLGHKKITTTLDIYAHVLPTMDQEAADTVGAVIHGKCK
jgi:integrase